MAQQEELILWIDRRWKDAIEKHLKGETLQERMENVLDELCNQLPEQEYARISREIYEEKRLAKEQAETSRTYSAYHVTEGGRNGISKRPPARNCWIPVKRSAATSRRSLPPDRTNSSKCSRPGSPSRQRNTMH